MKRTGNIGTLIEHFKDNAVISSGSADTTPTPIANRALSKTQRAYKQLRETEEGRAALMALMTDPEPAIREAAASYSIFWDELRAREVLLELGSQQLGLVSVNARVTLDLFDRGILSYEWD